MALEAGKKCLCIPDGKGGYTAYEISAPKAGEKCILLPDGKGGYIAVGTGVPSVGDKVPVVPDGKGGYLTWRPRCPTFNLINTGFSHMIRFFDQPNTTISIHNDVPYILGHSGGHAGFGMWNGTSFDFYESNDSLSNLSMDVDSDGVVWICGVADCTLDGKYCNLYSLKYDGVWTKTLVKYTGYLCERSPNMKIDNDDIPYIFVKYSKPPLALTFNISLFKWNGASWGEEIVDTTTDAWTNPPSALNFDVDNYPHFTNAHTSFPQYHTDYYYKDGAGWHNEQIQTRAYDFVLDEDKYPHMVTTTTGRIYYYYKDTDGWHSESIEVPPTFGEFPRIRRTPSGRIHISVIIPPGSIIDPKGAYWYFRTTGGVWNRCLIDDNSDISWCNLDTDSNFKPHFVFGDLVGNLHIYTTT